MVEILGASFLNTGGRNPPNLGNGGAEGPTWSETFADIISAKLSWSEITWTPAISDGVSLRRAQRFTKNLGVL